MIFWSTRNVNEVIPCFLATKESPVSGLSFVAAVSSVKSVGLQLTLRHLNHGLSLPSG